LFCNQCATENKADAKFCYKCGAAISIPQHSPNSPIKEQLTVSQITESVAIPPLDVVVQVRPWVRFWARTFDIILLGFAISFFLNFTISFFLEHMAIDVTAEDLFLIWLSVGFLSIFFIAFVEALLLSMFGATLGKWLLKTHLTHASGVPITYAQAFSRSLKVWWRGLGTGFPFIAAVTQIIAYVKLKRNGVTSWDREGDFVVAHEHIGIPRILLAIIFFIVCSVITTGANKTTIARLAESSIVELSNPPASTTTTSTYRDSQQSTKGLFKHTELTKYVGQHPTDLFRDPIIQRKFYSFLGKNNDLFLENIGVASPLEIIDNYYVGDGCAPHLCGFENAGFAINKTTGDIFAFLITQGEPIRFFGASSLSDLPKPLYDCNSLLLERPSELHPKTSTSIPGHVTVKGGMAPVNIGKIDPTDSVLKLFGKEYGPYVKEFDSVTNVYSVFYPLSGQKTGEADEEIIFCFYFKDVWAKNPISAQHVAKLFLDSGLNIVNKFQAPDPINKEPAFFIIASSDHSDQGYGYVFFAKVASYGENVYSILLSKKINGRGKDLQDNIHLWMADNIQALSINDMGASDKWTDDFRKFQK